MSDIRKTYNAMMKGGESCAPQVALVADKAVRAAGLDPDDFPESEPGSRVRVLIREQKS